MDIRTSNGMSSVQQTPALAANPCRSATQTFKPPALQLDEHSKQGFPQREKQHLTI